MAKFDPIWLSIECLENSSEVSVELLFLQKFEVTFESNISPRITFGKVQTIPYKFASEMDLNLRPSKLVHANKKWLV